MPCSNAFAKVLLSLTAAIIRNAWVALVYAHPYETLFQGE